MSVSTEETLQCISFPIPGSGRATPSLRRGWTNQQRQPNYRKQAVITRCTVKTHYTHLVPRLRTAVWWTLPPSNPFFGVASAGIKRLEPSAARFVKGEHMVHLSFEVVLGIFSA